MALLVRERPPLNLDIQVGEAYRWAEDDPNDTYHAITWKVADLERAHDGEGRDDIAVAGTEE